MATSGGARVSLNPTKSYNRSNMAGTSHDTRHWENLSHDLLIRILSKLNFHDLINGGSRVCSSWRAAARDPICWCDILGVERSKLLLDISDCGTPTEFWQFLCSLYGGFSRNHCEMVDIIIRKKI